MSYRSIKRVLGETRLEWKCRWLFGSCLFALIGGAFYWVDSVAEGLVLENTRNKGHDLVVMLQQRSHFIDAMKENERVRNDTDPLEYAKRLTDEFGLYEYFTYEILTPGDDSKFINLKVKTPDDQIEVEILRELQEEWEKQDKTPELVKKVDEPPLNENLASSLVSHLPKPRAFRDRRVRDKDEYQYFEPIVLSARRCRECHLVPDAVGAISAADPAAGSASHQPFLAAKVTISYKETQDAINQARAILIALGILTVFLAMVGLYVIVRYVIVKPLKHLRDVSDEISRGNLDTRAEIKTADEFQDMAESFNRMLRHLMDTQTDLRKVNKELDAKVDELAQLNMRLYEMNRLKGDFLANMSHELRTPLNSIIGFSEVLQGIESLNDKQKRYAQNIQKSGRLLLEMINDILDLAKMEAGKMDVRLSEFHIDSIVSAQCDMVRSLTEEKNIDLTVQVEPNLPPLYQDQAKVQQILTNLLSNAIKFTPEGGRITVTGRADTAGRLELTVCDTGIGIAPQDREIIFEKFRQGMTVVGDDGLTRKYSGTGLGLSIVRELCKLLGGEVIVESQVGHGSTFRILLPWSAPAAPRRESAALEKPADRPSNWQTEPAAASLVSSAAPFGV